MEILLRHVGWWLPRSLLAAGRWVWLQTLFELKRRGDVRPAFCNNKLAWTSAERIGPLVGPFGRTSKTCEGSIRRVPVSRLRRHGRLTRRGGRVRLARSHDLLIPKNQLEQVRPSAGRISGRSPACQPKVGTCEGYASGSQISPPRSIRSSSPGCCCRSCASDLTTWPTALRLGEIRVGTQTKP